MSDKPTHVQQAQNELASAEESGDTERLKAARKRLAAAGYEKPKAKAAKDEAPQKVAKDEAPQGRTTKQAARQQTVAKGED